MENITGHVPAPLQWRTLTDEEATELLVISPSEMN